MIPAKLDVRVEVSALGLRVQGMTMRVLRINYSRAHYIILVHGVWTLHCSLFRKDPCHLPALPAFACVASCRNLHDQDRVLVYVL